MTDAPKPPPERFTLTVPVIAAAKEVVFCIGGADKAAAVYSVLVEKAAKLPAQLVAEAAGAAKVHWFVDAAAYAQCAERQEL